MTDEPVHEISPAEANGDEPLPPPENPVQPTHDEHGLVLPVPGAEPHVPVEEYVPPVTEEPVAEEQSEQ